MTTLLAAVSGALVAAGLAMSGFWLWPAEPTPAKPRRGPSLADRVRRIPTRTRWLAAGGLVAGLLVAAFTGWWIAALVVPVAAVGLPVLVVDTPEKTRIGRMEAMAEWTRGLAGVLSAGIGLEPGKAAAAPALRVGQGGPTLARPARTMESSGRSGRGRVR